MLRVHHVRITTSPRIGTRALIAVALVILSAVSALAQPVPPRKADGSERISHRYWNLLTPEKYVEALDHVARMPDENDGKQGSSLLRTTRWQGIGPAIVRITPTIGWHGRMRAIRWYRNPITSSFETYLGASSGGLWFGNFALVLRVWTSLGDALPNPAVGSFLIDSLDPNTIWVGTGDWRRYGGAGLFKTTNRGGTWERVPITRGDVIPGAITGLEYGRNRSTMYLASDRGFFVSSDGGATWNRSATDQPAGANVYDMVIDPTDRNYIYLAAPASTGLTRSSDGGANWMRINSGIDLGRAGATTAIAIAASSPNILYAATSDTSGRGGMIYRSTNRGTNWTPTSTPLPYIDGGQSFHAHALAVAPNDPNKVYAGSVGFIRSVDAGRTWEWRESGHADLTSIEFLPGDPNYVYILSDGGLFIHNDETNVVRNISEAFTPSAPIQAYSLEDAWSNSKVMVSGTQDNGTLLTQQAGERDKVWTSIGGCDGGNTISIDPRDPNRIYFNSWCGASNPRLLSKDMGQTSGDISYGLPEIYYTPLRLNKGNTNGPFTVTRTHLYYSSGDEIRWLRATTAPGADFDTLREAVRMMTVNFQNDGPVAAYTWFWHNPPATDGRRMTIHRGTPGAMTMLQRTMPGNEVINMVVVDRWSANVAYAMTVWPARVYRTTNQGDTWENITGNLPDVTSWDLVTLPSNPRVMFIATDVGVFRTSTDGASWSRYQNGLPIVGANSFSYIRGEGFDTLRLATFGRGYWQRVIDGSDPIAWQIDTARLGAFSLRDIAVVRPGLLPGLVDTVVTVGASGIIGLSVDDAQSFRFAGLPSGILLRGVAASDCTHVTAVGDDGTIIHSNTTAREWTIVGSGVSVPLRGVTFVGDVGWSFGDDGVILRSTNKGAAWERVYNLKGTNWNAASFIDANTGWIVGGAGGQAPQPMLARTTDGGVQWILWQSPPAVFTSIQMLDADNGYATGDGGILYRTTNGGSSWEDRPSGFKTTLTDLVALSSEIVYVTTSDGRILRTGDGGKSWQAEEDIQALGALYAITKGTGELIAVGDSTVAFVRIGGEAPLDTVGKPPYIERFTAGALADAARTGARIESIAPNPTADGTTIGFTIAARGPVTIAIHTMLGEPIAVLTERTLSPGRHSVTWDGADASGRPVAAGAYLVRITAGSTMTSGRIAVVH